MVSADEFSQRTAALAEQPSAAMPAYVVKRADLLVVAANDDDGVVTDFYRDKVARLRHFRRHPDMDPMPGEDRGDVELEELGVAIEGGFETVSALASGEQRRGAACREVVPAGDPHASLLGSGLVDRPDRSVAIWVI